jgi:type I restriction enzyme, R subunit
VPNFISEDQIEKAAVALLTETYGYRTADCLTQDVENPADLSNRASKHEVVFLDVLKNYAVKLNKNIPEAVIEEAIEKLTARH